MIKIEYINTYNFDNAVRGMRNPLQSWDKSDSQYFGTDGTIRYSIGEADLKLMNMLYHAGTEHRKYLRQIFISMDITAPDYFFKQFSTYKIGVVENSTSTMHKIMSRPITAEDFSYDYLNGPGFDQLTALIDFLNECRIRYNKTQNKHDWYTIIQLLPMSYNYTRTVTMNYENAVSIIKQRKGHKLEEWHQFVDCLEKLPYIQDIMKED